MALVVIEVEIRGCSFNETLSYLPTAEAFRVVQSCVEERWKGMRFEWRILPLTSAAHSLQALVKGLWGLPWVAALVPPVVIETLPLHHEPERSSRKPGWSLSLPLETADVRSGSVSECLGKREVLSSLIHPHLFYYHYLVGRNGKLSDRRKWNAVSWEYDHPFLLCDGRVLKGARAECLSSNVCVENVLRVCSLIPPHLSYYQCLVGRNGKPEWYTKI